MKERTWTSPARFMELLRETAPPPEQLARRLQAVERDIILPVKAVFVGILLYYLFFSRWFEDVAMPRSVAQRTVEQFFLIYLGLNFGVALLLIFTKRVPSPWVQGVIFANSFVDGLFLAALTFVTGGFDSILYWLFLALNVRNALSVPLAVPQLILNVSAILCYLGAGILDMTIEDDLDSELNPTEPFLLRLIVLWLVAACCYGVQVLFERHRRAQEESREASARQSQLHSAGRLAAEIAHQLKNPLGIINNAAFSLQRACRGGAPSQLQPIEIIREEVAKSDRILTRLMGYARLAEGHVEKLNVAECLDQAIRDVFPEGSGFPVEVVRHYAVSLPPLFMQREHLGECFVNLLQNAREAMDRPGRVEVSVQPGPGQVIVVVIQDNGPGIPAGELGRIFGAYYSTKEKGTGLGLAIVKNNVEMYSGSVQVASEPGAGARFTLTLPTRTFMAH